MVSLVLTTLFCILCHSIFALEDPLAPECFEKPSTGPCRANIPRYYFNNDTGLCETFVFGGCNGNKNNFASIGECRKKCGSRLKTEVTDMCLQPLEIGSCEDFMPRYYFNWVEGDCLPFNYSGCQGNDNNFSSLKECRLECTRGINSDHRRYFCSLPPSRGPCRAHFPRFYYDAEEHRCKPFDYGSCMGNHNNFATQAECERACARLF